MTLTKDALSLKKSQAYFTINTKISFLSGRDVPRWNRAYTSKKIFKASCQRRVHSNRIQCSTTDQTQVTSQMMCQRCLCTLAFSSQKSKQNPLGAFRVSPHQEQQKSGAEADGDSDSGAHDDLHAVARVDNGEMARMLSIWQVYSFI